MYIKVHKYCLHIFFLVIFLIEGLIPMYATSRALLVGISNYSQNAGSGWSDINGVNDINILQGELYKQGFLVTSILDADATASNIRTSLQELYSQANQNDTIYIHFSGHGQPVEDLNGDELDGWDEAFVPIDAQMWYKQGEYEGENHFIDDELNIFINKIRRKLGAKGLLVVAIDACHSGTMSRDENDVPFEDESPIRGTYVGLSKEKTFHPIREKEITHHYAIETQNDLATTIILEACQAWQQNTEIKVGNNYYGPLSYAIYSRIKEQSFGMVVNNVESVNLTMQQVLPKWRNQQIVVETSIVR